VRVVLAGENIETIEKNDDYKVEESGPGGVWLEAALEYQSVAVNSLRLEGLVELDVGDADGAPSEEGGNGRQILEPVEHDGRSTRRDREIGQAGNGGSDRYTPVWHTGLAAVKEEARGLPVLR